MTGGAPDVRTHARPQPTAEPEAELLAVDDLRVRLRQRDRHTDILRGVSFTVRPGEVLGMVGGTGSGKSMTALAVLGLLPPSAEVDCRQIAFEGRDLSKLDERAMRRVRGARISLIPQSAKNALNPLLPVEKQMANVLGLHRPGTKREVRAHVEQMLEAVGLEPRRVIGRYPHELSGGMAQRVAIAIGLGTEPRLVIADEPTTGLDATVQAHVLDYLIQGLLERGTSALLISHDLGVVANYCDRVVVMHAGEIAECADVATLFSDPQHDYTRSLLNASAASSAKGHRS